MKENIRDFIKSEVDFKSLKTDTGIFETAVYTDGLSIGVSKETSDEGNIVFIFNLFCGDEYINISDHTTEDNILSDEMMQRIENEIRKLKEIQNGLHKE